MTEYRTLGRTGVKVSPLALGTMMFGPRGNPDHDDSIRIIHHALDSGINFVDTADVYSAGESETIVGKALAGGRRDDVVLATKFHGSLGDDHDGSLDVTGREIRVDATIDDVLERISDDLEMRLELYLQGCQCRRPWC